MITHITTSSDSCWEVTQTKKQLELQRKNQSEGLVLSGQHTTGITRDEQHTEEIDTPKSWYPE